MPNRILLFLTAAPRGRTAPIGKACPQGASLPRGWTPDRAG